MRRRRLQDWLAADERNVAAIHCKAGKGRTGVIITAFLMYCKDWEEPEDAMAFYGFARTNNQKGITIPSQRTFIYYWHKVLKDTAMHEAEDVADVRASTMTAITPEERAAIKAATQSTLKEGGEEDDSESDPEVEKEYKEDPDGGTGGPAAAGGGVDASIMEQVEQLVALRDAGHLTPEEFEEAKKQVYATAGVAEVTVSSSGAAPPPAPGAGQGLGGGAAAAAEEASSDEEEDDDAGGAKKSMFKGFKGFGMGKKKGLAKTAQAHNAKAVDPLMDRSWNDRNRAEPPTRGQIPGATLKLMTKIRMNTVPKGGYEPNFIIFSGGNKYESKDMCMSEHYSDKLPYIDIAIPPLPVIDEIFVVFYKPGNFGKKKKMLQFWFHASFVEGDTHTVPKKDMDKAIKDKKHKKYSKDFALVFTLVDAPPGTEDPRRDFVPGKCSLK